MTSSMPSSSDGFRRQLRLSSIFVLVVMFAIHNDITSGETAPLTFVFTRPTYNASLVENSPGKSYIQPAEPRMGIHVGAPETSPLIDVSYTIVDGDANKLFKTESRRVGDFCFLALRTRSGLSASINREQTDSYRLVIVGSSRFRGGGGAQLTARTEVLITVVDANDLSPLFDRSEYRVEVPEGVPLHRSIARVTASDADVGVNGEIYYGFAQTGVGSGGGSDAGAFAIHPTTGVVTVVRRLSAADRSSYDLEILAKDRGPSATGDRSGRVARAWLYVTIISENLHEPEIVVNDLPSVVEHGAVGTIYAILSVKDRDYGRGGQLDTVRISAGDPDGYFRVQQSGVDPTEYVIEVMKMLDRESHVGGFNLTLEATDRGRPSLTGRSTVNVRLQDVNDNPPLFSSEIFHIKVDECLPINTPVLAVAALDGDSGENGRVTYSIEDFGTGLFSIGSSSGVLSIAGKVDAEVVTQLNLTVVALDHANFASRRLGSALVEIEVLDCNDNAPVFSIIQTAYVDENQPPLTPVYQVEAMDADHGENGFVSYSLINADGLPFTIDPFTGLITTKETLDFESMPHAYSLLVRASDWGTPFHRGAEAVVRIKVRDANDNSPQFERANCTVHLSRDMSPGTEVIVASAIDFDKSSVVSYGIASGNDDDCFDIDQTTGQLRTKVCSIGLAIESRTVVLTASDGINEAEPMSVNITLIGGGRNRRPSGSDLRSSSSCQETHVAEELMRLDGLRQSLERSYSYSSEGTSSPSEIELNRFTRNPHTPRFALSTLRKLSIREGYQLGVVANFSAIDEDHGYNGRLLYTISSGNDGDVFQVDTYSGILSVRGTLDREIRDRYLLNVTVFDMGVPQRMASLLADIAVEDVNDNAPIFERVSYTVGISESIAVDSQILTVVAHDRDLGANGRVTYRLLSNEDAFSIDSATGVIKVIASLDRETISSYELTVIAVDSSSSEESLTGTTLVAIRVDDVNDNPPTFQSDSYHVRVLEDLPVGTVVTTLYARDPDLGSAGAVRYSLVDGAEGYFEIDRPTGIVRLARELSFNTRQLYNITAQAKDRSQERPLWSRCQVLIEVVPVQRNLFAPTFRDYVFQGRVRENQPPGTSVMQLVAHDKDSLGLGTMNNYQIKYSIRNGTGLGRFGIDNKGTIFTRDVLDRETQSFYWLTVYAQDLGMVPLSSFTEVLIEVDDVNDNVPLTPDPVYYPTVLEGSPVGTPVLRLEAFDLDGTANGALTYEITGGNPQGFFSINRTNGLISTTSRILDREKQDEHILEVTVYDNGVPSLSSATRVVVGVTDDNDESPQFLERQYRIRVPRLPVARLAELGVYRVIAYDRDIGPNGDIDYSLANDRSGRGGAARFRINTKTGVIHAVKELEDAQYDFVVKASDNGRPQQRTSAGVRITVVDVPSTSQNAPVFTSNSGGAAGTAPVGTGGDGGTEVRLMESDEVGSLVSIVSAEDADGDKVWYYITDGNTGDTFSIDVENGNIVLARRLDREGCPEYNLTVMATDGALRTYTSVSISILDISDNSPIFDQSTYVANIPENAPPGTVVVVLRATDLDEDKQLFYTIHSATSAGSLTKFKINSETGVISTMEELNHEVTARHELTVMVRDSGTKLPKRGFARVVVNVVDQNDHAPEFLSSEYEGHIYSTSAAGTSVLQVQTFDRDKGVNAQVLYSILSGNVGSVFNIDRTLGLVTVSGLTSLDQSTYRLVVRAADQGSPSLSSTASVVITVATSNTASPVFDVDELFMEVPENQPEGSFIAAVHASCQSSVTYSLVDSSDRFVIDPSSGVVVAGSTGLDHELAQVHNVTVKAMNFGGLFSVASLVVHVTDLNDNRPVFSKRSYSGTVAEGSPVGTDVLEAAATDSRRVPLVVRASDADSGLNSLLTYRIVGSRAAELFQIDAETGAVRTKVVLDREMTSIYQFSVQVSDSGTPSKTAEYEANVTILVDDINDTPPVFDQQMYNVKLLLPTHPDVVVARVSASDADVNATIRYAIDAVPDQQSSSLFHIDSWSGVVTVTNSMLEADTLSRYNVTVTASDGKYVGRAVVCVEVDRMMSSGLRFSEPEYEAEVTENSTEVQRILLLRVVGQLLDEHVTFSLLNAGELFSVHPTSGAVMTTGVPFDRERRGEYSVVAEVRDGRTPPRVGHAVIHVVVTDVNDNAPVFTHQPYFAMVSVDALLGAVVRKVTAIDRDAGNNSAIAYYIVDGISAFDMRVDTGEIIVNHSLSETKQNFQHRLTVEARDKGEIMLSSRTYVVVTVVNKAMPIFVEPFYSASVAENVQSLTPILTVSARSPMGNSLVYSIVSGDEYGEFAVDFNVGAITLIDQLDYETNKNYQLVIRATDVVSRSFADTNVRIQVEDVNDNEPMFELSHYVVDISESAPTWTSVLTVTAMDADSGSNARLRYHIEPLAQSSSDSNYFYIDSERGIVLLRQRLDCEQADHLRFIVVAMDSGIPTLSASTTVTVNVTDVNDNAPKFDQSAYEASISDRARRGQFVAAVRASDADSSNRGQLTYAIVGGNSRQSFAIGPRSGVITVSNAARKLSDLPGIYLLNVSATDQMYMSFARVRVTVEGSNLHAPAFARQIYDVDVTENQPPGLAVVSLVAVDGDRGIYGDVTYRIVSEDADDLFMVDPRTGGVTTKALLDRETKGVHEIRVSATDGGGLTGFTMVRVRVADQGDREPVFSAADYKANVYSNARIDTTVLQVLASDKDNGDAEDVEYTIVIDDSGSASTTQYFSLGLKTGFVVTNATLIGVEKESFQFFIRATSVDGSQRHSDVPVVIYVMGTEDRPPVFDQDLFRFNVVEDSPPSTTVASVTAHGEASVTYSIVSEQNRRMSAFAIDNTGVVTTAEQLDRETAETYELTIRAETLASPPLVTHTRFVVHVTDVNDNAPRFETDQYQSVVAENRVMGSQVLQVVAKDRDAGANGELIYQLVSGTPPLVADSFSVDPTSGWITTAVILDRESTSEFRFHVEAVDRGRPAMTSTTQVVLTVGDENDNPPQFQQATYSGAVNEDALPGTIIIVVLAADADVSPNNAVSYSIVDGDPLGQFGVRRSGELYVNKLLDREEQAQYDLSIVATDGAFVSTASVSVSILDANDNAPTCDQAIYSVDVIENVAIGSYVVRVTASDADEPGTRNSRLEFFLVSEENDMFTVHKKSGVITTMRLLDREEVADYHLNVIVRDGGGLSCHSQVHIVLTDVNDNAPVFTSRAQYAATALENADIGTAVVRVVAVDPDIGINRRVRYALDGAQGDPARSVFSVDAVSGVLTLLQPLDREDHPFYNVSVIAIDQGSPQLSSFATVIVTVLDVNDNPPEFERTIYAMSVSEAVSIGTTVGQVFATSRDIGINAEITYAIIGSVGNDFSIDSDTGSIMVARVLDYELIKEYVVTVEARDGGTPPLSGTTVVKIDVVDANDNRPIFVQLEYQAVVREDVAVNTSLLQVEAVDADVGVNGRVEYRIIGGDSRRQFAVNPTQGQVYVTASLDREQVQAYELVIAAIDNGVPALTSSTLVKIELLDINDSPPQFANANFTAPIQVDENGNPMPPPSVEAGLGTVVFQLMVTDPDLDPNGPPFTYDIIAGNQNEFYVDRNGAVRTATKFNRQIKDLYRLVIRVYDNGQPPLYSEVSLDAVVIEDSASPPVITPLAVTVQVAGDSYPGGDIGRLRATDRDLGDQLLFSIVHDEDRELFDIDTVDGTLRAVQAIDVGEYVVNISVTDGRFIRFADARVTVDVIAVEARDNAVVVRVDGLTPEEFVQHHLQGFVLALRSELAVRESDIKVLSVQPASNIFGGRRRRSDADTLSQQIDVLVAVQKTDSKFYRGNSLKRRIESVARAVEQQADIHIARVFNNICNKDSCLNGNDATLIGADCVTVVILDGDTPVTIVTDGESFVSVKHQLHQRCVCRPGSSCGAPVVKEICTPGLCREPKVCRSDGQSYMCICPDGRAGEECRDLVDPPCVDLACRKDKPMTFSGNSFIRWRLTVPMERRLSLTLELRTVQKRARLMHAVGRVDYSILEIEDGMIQYRFDCGSGPGVVRVDKMQINDGYWHTVVVERISKSVRVIIDGIHVGDGSGPGTNDLLNLDSNDVFFGAEVEPMANGAFDDVRNGFVGCMQRIRIDQVDLPLYGGSSVAVLQGMQDIEFHCRGIYIPGVCSSSPCRNGGSCSPQSADSYICKCRGRFSGHHCDIDSNPCASNPCLNGGTCENLLNSYHCTCPNTITGTRCEQVSFCDPNPCLNNAQCREDAIGPICTCAKGYEGDLCEYDIDECLSSPCDVTASCQNLIGGFLCNCSVGKQCIKGYSPSISTGSIGIHWEEAVGIAGKWFNRLDNLPDQIKHIKIRVCKALIQPVPMLHPTEVVILALLIIALVIVVIIRHRRQRSKHRQLRTVPTDPTVFGTCEVDNDIGSISDKTTCLSNGRWRQSGTDNGSVASQLSPRLPVASAKRPTSCTFATGNLVGGSKFDSPIGRTMDYGSAGDELERAGQLQRAEHPFPSFVRATNVAGAKSPTSPQSNPLQSPTKREPSPRGLNNLNKAEYYRNKHQDKLRKVIPTGAGNQSMQSLQLLPEGASVSDLAISESEDDAQGLFWDTSDWNPAAIPLLPMGGDVRVSPTSSHHSTDYNVDIDPSGYDATDVEDQFDPADDSEYVNDDSEFTENECDDGFEGYNDDEPNVSYPPQAASASLDFQQILAMRDELNYGTEGRDKSKRQPRRGTGPKRSASSAGYGVHPNMYLPTYNISLSGSVVNDDGIGNNSAEPEGLNGNFTSADYISRDDDDDVLQWGFPATASLLRPKRGDRKAREVEDAALDSMSMSGCRSTNDSELDLAAVCEIEDSDVNLSDEDDIAAIYARRKLLASPGKSAHTTK